MSVNPKSGDNYVVNQIGERRDIGMVKWNDFLENENQKIKNQNGKSRNRKEKRKIEEIPNYRYCFLIDLIESPK